MGADCCQLVFVGCGGEAGDEMKHGAVISKFGVTYRLADQITGTSSPILPDLRNTTPTSTSTATVSRTTRFLTYEPR
jgi:hypothetical protein